MSNFPSNDELNAQTTKSSSYLKWKDLPENICYKIESQRYIETKIGSSLILHLTDRLGITYDVFSTSLVKKELELYPMGVIYVKSTGKKPGKKYYGFDLVEININEEKVKTVLKLMDWNKFLENKIK